VRERRRERPRYAPLDLELRAIEQRRDHLVGRRPARVEHIQRE
jgi:hypothetical protein